MDAVDVSQLSAQLSDYFLRYYETAFSVRDEATSRERRQLLAAAGALFQEPYIELLPDYVSSTRSVSEMTNDLRLPAEFAGLASILMPGIERLYLHQEQALKAALDGRNVVVTSGTGSGKTEAFLLPILARLVRESGSWSAPPTGGGENEPWWKSREFVPQRKVWEGRPAAVRAMVLYPMNALVEDQLVRLRRVLTSAAADAWFAGTRPGHRYYFGRYTGQTPVSGQRKSNNIKELGETLARADLRFRRLMEVIQAESPKDPDGDRRRFFLPSVRSGEVPSRWDMQDVPPDVLITNYSMLNIMMMRRLEEPIFEQTRQWITASPDHVFTLVVDELHMYRGTAGTEVGYLLRKLVSRLGLETRPKQLSILATSASLEGEREKDLQFLEDFFAVGKETFTVIRGDIVRPSGPPNLQHVVEEIDELADRTPPASVTDLAAWIADEKVHGSLFDNLSEKGWPRATGIPQLAGRLFPELDESGGRAKLEKLVRLVAGADAGVRLRASLHEEPQGNVGLLRSNVLRC